MLRLSLPGACTYVASSSGHDFMFPQMSRIRFQHSHELPMRIPVKNTSTPPTTTKNAACKNGVSIYLCRIQLITPNSTHTTKIATVIATWKFLIRKGSVCPKPPAVVIPPIISPRIHGDPLPVSDPSSDNDSANPIEIPAPTDAAIPTRNASHVLCEA